MMRLTEEEKRKLKEKIQEASAHRTDRILEKEVEIMDRAASYFRELRSSFSSLPSDIRSMRLRDLPKWWKSRYMCPVCGAKMKRTIPFRTKTLTTSSSYCPKCGYGGYFRWPSK